MNFIIKPIQSYLWITHLLLQKPRLLLLCIKPWIYGILCWAVLFLCSFPLKDTIRGSLDSAIPGDLIGYAAPFIMPILFLLTGLVALLFALIVNEYIIDTFIEKTACEADPEKEGTIKKRGAVQQTVDCFLRLFITLPLSIICLIIGLIPVVNGLSIFLSSIIIGYAIIDCPLCILGKRFSDRLGFIFDNFLAVLMLGLIFSPTFIIPGLSLLLLPLGYGAATKLIELLSITGDGLIKKPGQGLNL